MGMRKRFPHVPILLTLEPGEHGFDVGLDRREPCVQEGCQFVEQFWS